MYRTQHLVRVPLTVAALLALTYPAIAADVTVQLSAGDGFVVEDNTATIERLRVDEATGNVSRNGALFVHTTGSFSNTFVGVGAGNTSTPGSQNSAFGRNALNTNTGGVRNAAFGTYALRANTTGYDNSAFGRDALRSNTTGIGNSAFGEDALKYNTFTSNSAFGHGALRANTTGYANVAIGNSAGSNQTTGDRNIYIANIGVAGESGQIKIGTAGTHTDAFIAGIDGNVVVGSGVRVTASGEVGVGASSARFKHDVKDMAADSSVLLDLRPVTFLYRDEVGGANDERQYGLLAEQVANVAPDLVRLDDEGKPFSVHYEQLAPMLINEVQKQQRTIEGQRREIAALADRLAAVEGQLAPPTEPSAAMP